MRAVSVVFMLQLLFNTPLLTDGVLAADAEVMLLPT